MTLPIRRHTFETYHVGSSCDASDLY